MSPRTRGATLISVVAFVAVVAATISAANSLAAQQPPATATPSVSTITELVLVPAVVTDHKGEPIGGLQKPNFTVLENGIEQKVAVFEEVTTDTEFARHVPPSGEGEFNNYLLSHAAHQRLTIFVFDLGQWWNNREYGREMLVKYLMRAADEGEPMVLLALDANGLHLLHDATTDPKVLAAALRHFDWGTATRGTDTGDGTNVTPKSETNSTGISLHETRDEQLLPQLSGNQQMLGAAQQDMDREIARLRGFDTGEMESEPAWAQKVWINRSRLALEIIAHGYAGVPGRKALVWVSDRFPPAFRQPTGGFREYLLEKEITSYQRTLDALVQAQVSMYPISTRGFMPGDIMTGMAVRGRMRDLASETGGRAFYGRNDLDTGFREAVDDSRHYYMLGYYRPKRQERPGWRNVRVQVDSPEARVRARSGFFVAPRTAAGWSGDEVVDFALASNLPFTGLPIKARAKYMGEDKVSQNRVLEFSIAVVPEAITVDEVNGNHIELLYTLMAEVKGKTVFSTSRKVEGHLQPAALQSLRKGGVAYSTQAELSPGEYRLHFVVRDNLSGKVGSIVTPFKVGADASAR